ncbi:hypothetical protein B484DRAFT_457448 [Ochromonadaceae sp. CCMP2298]|nr:hypothetical protein B484DRAFT_457448 [Ochromonadaceae sp. CCMP2298]|mmetsp:Transcript_20921/g.47332  ORF Transcript_20921/g.47332 Transcript_20921/m.47332 type:complete len:443 (+) Transcript_20921:162-1490(+)|eukprot:CAMPEP_0173204472 /NCGR_PEP_ID=MMETSP1141-20130122/20141_1 /TAXON_ID=483371 /ORGANISM="non described non described, Strain CCMP2298" /LENGTH=442 /DNA_ID=CAMNT_0014130139 /DNA_START=64 /DNA_END=1392 /DNA_ORIENTATION=+
MNSAEMLDDLLCNVGVPVYILSKHGVKTRSSLKVVMKGSHAEPHIQWRSRLSCEFSFVNSITTPKSSDAGHRISLVFEDFVLTLEVESESASEIHDCLSGYQAKAQEFAGLERERNTSKETGNSSAAYQQTLSLRKAIADAALREEELLQLVFYLRLKEGHMIMEKLSSRRASNHKKSAFKQWVHVVRNCNTPKMNKDRSRWRLHAFANQEIDLQAWYHALFYLEVYRLRGHFWYKDAVLPVYKHSYDLVDNALTPLEEAALAHVLCSPDTSYGDVAGQMFVVQALIPPAQFALFQQLAAVGATVVKYPRSGRPAKKTFRFSFVEGNIYLTWKGKFGNQGVGMGEVTSVVGGIESDVLKWSVKDTSKGAQYLSVNCLDRSVDLYFDNSGERDNWRDLLKTLVTKEQGALIGIEAVDPPVGAALFEWLVLYASIGKEIPQARA